MTTVTRDLIIKRLQRGEIFSQQKMSPLTGEMVAEFELNLRFLGITGETRSELLSLEYITPYNKVAEACSSWLGLTYRYNYEYKFRTIWTKGWQS